MKSLEEEYHSVDKQCSDLAAIVDSIEGDITTKEQACDSLKKDTEVFVEQQIELTMLKMDVTNNKLEHAKAQIKCQVSTRKLACHKKEFQRAKNLLVSLQMLIIWPMYYMYPISRVSCTTCSYVYYCYTCACIA